MYIILFFLKLISKTFNIQIPLLTHSSNIKSLRSLNPSSVYGNSHDLNYYYSYLYIGEQKKKQSYILDTGSSITTSPCNLCNNCGRHENEYYEINENKILKCFNNECSYVNNICNIKENDCEFLIKYNEGSLISGKYVKEYIFFENNYLSEKLIEIPIGCTNQETYFFYTQFADGIMGLQNTEKSIISILFKKGFIKNNIFTLCFDYEGGFFSIGEIFYESHLNNKISYMNIPKSNFYQVNIINIEINGKIIHINNENDIIYNSIIDSGTTISYFPYFIVEKFINEIKEKCNQDEFKDKCGINKIIRRMGNCFIFKSKKEMIYAINNIFPNITFYFQGNFTFIWEAQNYYINNSKNEFMVCFGFEGQNSYSITLGSTFIKGYDFIFNIEESKIGFVKANCSYLKGKNNIKVDIKKNNYLVKIIICVSFGVIFILVLLFYFRKKIKNYFTYKKYSKVINELNGKNNQDNNVNQININIEEKKIEIKETENNNENKQ